MIAWLQWLLEKAADLILHKAPKAKKATKTDLQKAQDLYDETIDRGRGVLPRNMPRL